MGGRINKFALINFSKKIEPLARMKKLFVSALALYAPLKGNEF